MKDVLGDSWPERFVRFGAYVLSLGFAYLWLVFVDTRSAVYSDAQITAMVGLGVVACLFLFGLLLNILWVIPAALWREQSDKIGGMDERLTPKFRVVVAAPKPPEGVSYGNTSLSWGGKLQSVILQQNNIFKIDVENPGDVPLAGCEAYLARFSDVDVGEPPHWQSMRLPWLQVEGQIDGVTIPSKGRRSISLFRVLNNRTVFLTTDIPVPVVHAIKDKGEYSGLIVLTALGSAATYVTFSLKCDAPDHPPILTIAQDSQNA